MTTARGTLATGLQEAVAKGLQYSMRLYGRVLPRHVKPLSSASQQSKASHRGVLGILKRFTFTNRFLDDAVFLSNRWVEKLLYKLPDLPPTTHGGTPVPQGKILQDGSVIRGIYPPEFLTVTLS
jgi:hypothetical protein